MSVALIVAHADDETLAAGGLLQSLNDWILIHITDSAPRDNKDAHAKGFSGWQEYAAARERELREALAISGARIGARHMLGVPDAQARFHVEHIAGRLRAIFAQSPPALIITHACEGGHADHDAAAMAVSQLRPSVPVLEFPLYAPGLRQRFADGGGFAFRPDGLQLRRKARMVAAFKSQQDVISGFALTPERFRAFRPCAS